MNAEERVDAPIHIHFCSQDPALARMIAEALGSGFETRHSTELDLFTLKAHEKWVDVILLDLHSGEASVFGEWLDRMEPLRRDGAQPPIIVMLGAHDRATTLHVIEQGAYDTINHPPDILELRLALSRAYKFRQAEEALRQTRKRERSVGRLGELIGASESMQDVFELVQKIAPCDVNVLISGETGTGKELLARAIHRLSPRSPRPFVAFSCANLPESLIEDELFGHERGAFTGALTGRQGRLESADHGTVFLDEIADLGFGLQPKLLRVLQEKTFERLGSNTSITVNVRTIFATNRDLAEMVQQGKFREDLYYRLNVVQVHLPPLRERRDDVSFLAKHFLDTFSAQFDKKASRFSQSALRALEDYAWPGNVRQLQNVIQRAVVLSDSRTIEAWHLPSVLRNDSKQVIACGFSYEEEVREFKRRLILRTLRECGWKKAESARSLKVARGYLHRLINQLQIRREAEEIFAQELTGKDAPSAEPAPKRIM